MSQPERRFLTSNPPKSSGRKVSGYGALFGSRSQNLGTTDCPMHEIILPGAFDGRLNDTVLALFNHDQNLILARTAGGEGTLKLSVDNIGLRYEFEAAETTTGNDLLEGIRRGDIAGSSFAFTVAHGGDTWTPEGRGALRTIAKISRLFDCSPVVSPAYAETTVTARALTAIPTPTPIRNAWAKRFELLK